MTARDVFILCVVLALILAVAGLRGGWLGRRGPKRARFATLEEQIAADCPAHHDEAKALIDSVLVHAGAEHREMVWRRVLDGSRGDIARLRKLAPTTVESLRKIYRLLGDDGGGKDDAA